MADADEIQYYRERELRERELAKTAEDAKIGQIHMTMALRYASLLAEREQGTADGAIQ
jgi:hypothetical protein